MCRDCFILLACCLFVVVYVVVIFSFPLLLFLIGLSGCSLRGRDLRESIYPCVSLCVVSLCLFVLHFIFLFSLRFSS